MQLLNEAMKRSPLCLKQLGGVNSALNSLGNRVHGLCFFKKPGGYLHDTINLVTNQAGDDGEHDSANQKNLMRVNPVFSCHYFDQWVKPGRFRCFNWYGFSAHGDYLQKLNSQ